MAIDWNRLRDVLELSAGVHQRNDLIPPGEYTGRMVDRDIVRDSWGRMGSRVTLEVTEGDHTGSRLTAYVYGTADALLKSRTAREARLLFRVYIQRSDDGRAYSRVNVETLRLAPHIDSLGVGPEVEVPTAASIQQAAADFTVGFSCFDRIDAKRSLVAWHEHFAGMAACTASDLHGRCVFGSTFCFTEALGAHIAAKDLQAEAAGIPQRGSMAGFNGPAYSPLITFDIDRYDSVGNGDPATAQTHAVRLVGTLLELGVPADLILAFYSGSKGFHIQIPSSLAGAVPTERFAATSGEFCAAVAGQSGVQIDTAMYRTLQPLRSPNSRHEKTGRYKVRLSVEELQTLSLADIEALAASPRPFMPPEFAHEPLSSLVAMWQRADGLVINDVAGQGVAGGEAGGEDARLFRGTWDFLVNGAPEGSRATELFKAAANLMDFESVEALARALLQRPAQLSGLTPAEVSSHIDGAVRRAAEGL